MLRRIDGDPERAIVELYFELAREGKREVEAQRSGIAGAKAKFLGERDFEALYKE